MPNIVEWLDRTLYPQYGPNWDDALFRREILDVVSDKSWVLDLGAGAGVVEQMNFRGRAARLCGVDPDERVLTNPFLDEAKVGVGESIPYQREMFDVVVADNVLEHLEQPGRVFGEVARILKPGGVLLVKTPNRRHYIPAIARLTPHWFHRWVNRQRGRDDDDTFPTFYRANTPAALKRDAAAAGLMVRRIRLVEGRPEYMRLCWPLYLAGWTYERLVNGVSVLEPFRVVMTGVLQKPYGPIVDRRTSVQHRMPADAA